MKKTKKKVRRLWQSPIYRFRIPLEENSDKMKEVVFDVTRSAPPIKEISEEQKTILKEIFSTKEFGKIEKIIEFGAGKLKNIPFLLDNGKTVCAVEFEELTKNKFTQENISKCMTYKNKFNSLIFPNPFIKSKEKFDMVLLFNVPPVMPVFAERMYLVDLLCDKVKDNKFLLWVAQREGSYKEDRESGKYFCGDGIWQGKTHYMKSFYKYHWIEDLDEMMALYGFELVKRWNLGSDARLYKKTKYNLFKGLISEKRILDLIPLDESIENPMNFKPKVVNKQENIKAIIPNPRELSIESLYIEKIKSIPEGLDHAEEYHRVVSYAMARIFRGSLRNMDLKQDIKEGIKIIDTLFTNCAKEGFFHNLRDEVKCNYPIIEVKNYTDDAKNPEIDQLNGRFNRNHGQFGILACRHIEDEGKMYERCATVDNVILFLTDNDIFELLELSRENSYDEISDFMDKKLRTLLFKKR